MRSVEAIRADVAVTDASETWNDRYHDAIVRLLHDVEPLLAEVEMQRRQIATAVDIAERWTGEHFAFDAVLAALSGNPPEPTVSGEMCGFEWVGCYAADLRYSCAEPKGHDGIHRAEHEHRLSSWGDGSFGSRYRHCLDQSCDFGEIA